MATSRFVRWSSLCGCLLFCVLSVTAQAATKRYPTMPSNGSVVGSGVPQRSGDLLSASSALEGEFIPSAYSGPS